MKIHILSDLHIEFARFTPPPTTADVVVLAGDIGVGAEAIRQAGAMFPDKPVIYVVGNHEFYQGNMQDCWQALRKDCPANVHLLENESVLIGGVRFLGCCLWTDYALFGAARQGEAMAVAGAALNDHRLISFNHADLGEGPFLPAQALALHQASRDWLQTQLDHADAVPTVVITHHAPHWQSVASYYAEDILSAAFVSDLSPLMGPARLWIHGHTHTSFDYAVNGTRVVSNPRGYRLRTGGFENRRFDDALVVEI